MLDKLLACCTRVDGNGLDDVSFVGIASSTGGVDAPDGVEGGRRLARLVYFRFGRGSVLGVATFLAD